MSIERRRQMIEPEHAELSIVRQCELVSISRSGFYHRPAGETPLNLELMRLIEQRDGPFEPQVVRILRRGGHGAEEVRVASRA